MNPAERQRAFGTGGSTEGGAGVSGSTAGGTGSTFKQTPSAKKTGEQASKEAQGATSGLDKSASDFANRKRGPSGAVVNFKKFSDRAINPEVVSSTPFDPKQNRGSRLSKSAAAYSKFAKNNPALGGVAGLAAYDIGKGILGKVKKYTKAILQTLNVQKPTKTGRISAGT